MFSAKARVRLIVLIIFATPSIAISRERVLDLPEYVAWCKPITISEVDAESVEKQTQARQLAIDAVDKELEKMGETFTGVPYLGNVVLIPAKTSADVNKLSVDVCLTVKPGIGSPVAGDIKVSARKGEKVAATICPRSSGEECITDLQMAVANMIGGVSVDEVKKWPWRFVPTDKGFDDVDLANEFARHDIRPIHGSYSLFVFGEIPPPPDPKKIKEMRPLVLEKEGNVITIASEEGKRFIAAITLP